MRDDLSPILVPETLAPPAEEPPPRLDTRGLSLRAFAARGVLVNAVFDVGVGVLGLVRGLAVAALLTRAQLGVWGALVVALGLLAQLKVIGISDKYIQQDDADQRRAFQHAFTLELASAGVMLVPLACAVPLIALLYGDSAMLAPGFVLVTMVVLYAFQSPQWIHYRRMNFLTQRLQTGVEPVVGLIVAVGLAIAGAGYWSLVIGAWAGAGAGAVVACAMSPYPLALAVDRDSLRGYWAFSGPVLVATVAQVVLVNVTMVATDLRFGLAGVGALTLAASITAFTTKVDQTIATTIYPAVCAIADRVELLRESFLKTNRLAMLWAIPFGVGVALFAPELIRYLLGERWRTAVPLLAINGAVAAVNHVGFNWDDYFRARAETRPVAVNAIVGGAVTLAVAVPLLWVDGLTGLAIGIGAGAGATLVVRAVYIRRLFGDVHLAGHGARAMVPVLPAVAAVLGLRLLLGGGGLAGTLVELVLYVGLAAAASLWLERRLLGEALAILRRPA